MSYSAHCPHCVPPNEKCGRPAHPCHHMVLHGELISLALPQRVGPMTSFSTLSLKVGGRGGFSQFMLLLAALVSHSAPSELCSGTYGF